jgi:cytochrome c-type biogenesis protein CcmF
VLGGRVAHFGLAVLVVGVAVSSASSITGERTLRTGDHLTVDGVSATLVSVGRERNARTMSTSAVLRLTGRGHDGGTMTPALRFFPAQGTTVAVPAIVPGFRGDVYATLLSARQDGTGARIRLAVNPLVDWIWAGGALMVLGSLVGLRSRRRNVVPEPAGGEAEEEAVDEVSAPAAKEPVG